eukprot:522282-Pyramimonas_sp.AAC.1
MHASGGSHGRGGGDAVRGAAAGTAHCRPGAARPPNSVTKHGPPCAYLEVAECGADLVRTQRRVVTVGWLRTRRRAGFAGAGDGRGSAGGADGGAAGAAGGAGEGRGHQGSGGARAGGGGGRGQHAHVGGAGAEAHHRHRRHQPHGGGGGEGTPATGARTRAHITPRPLAHVVHA